MATPNEVRVEIYTRLATLSSSILKPERISFDNRKFQEPTEGEWMSLAVRHTERSQETIAKVGERRFRSLGFVFVQVFTEVGSDMKEAYRIAKAIADFFDTKTFHVPDPLAPSVTTPLTFEAAVTRESGAGEKWNMVTVEAPFSYDEVK